MATSSGTTYQVFLSFRGPDTRQGFADFLYYALTDAGIHVFRDDEEIRKGEDIGDEIRRAISESRIFVPIFSRGYASSKWCLMELAMFKTIQESESGRKILPIFYDVGVDDVKLRTELYAEALLKHREKFSPDEVQQWEEALQKAGKIKGWEVKDMGHGKFIKLFVREVSEKLKVKHKYVTDKIVQRDDDEDKLMKLLDIEAFDVRFVVIHGMGGIGKTTLAKNIFNKLCDGYEGCSFLDDVRESSRHHGGIEQLQKKLLRDLGFPSRDIAHVGDGIMQLSQNLWQKKVLIVLDDVDHRKQIDNLVGDASWFGKGSRIIITTRNREVLGGGVQTLEVVEMKTEEALQLFSKHAFSMDSPPNEYLYLSEEAIQSTGRLPLALELIGSELRQTTYGKWAKTIERYKKIPHKDVQDMLMISYKSLDPGAQKIFLDIACFFINHERRFPMYMWEACDFDAKMGLKELIQKSLVKIVVKEIRDRDETIKEKRLWMHDQLRDLGMNIAKRSRIWMHEDAKKVLLEEEDKLNVEMLRIPNNKKTTHECYYDDDDPKRGNCYYCELDERYVVTREEFSGLGKLRYLQCIGANFSGDLRDLFPNLRWLSWRNCPMEFDGARLSFKKLVILDISYSSITEEWIGWSQIGERNNLKVLNLTDCRKLRKTPDFSKYLGLERLILKDCSQLVEIDPSIGKLKCLKFLNVSGCRSLKGFPEELCSLDCLEVILGYNLRVGYELDGFLTAKIAYIRDRSKVLFFNLPASIGDLISLSTLVLHGAENTELPHSIGRLSGLRRLSLCENRWLGRLPNSLANLESLVELHISLQNIVELPQTVGQLKKLQILKLVGCEHMKKLPDSIGDMKSLVELCLIQSGITELPETIGNLEELREIHLACSAIQKLPTSIGKLKRLEKLFLEFSSQIEIPTTIEGCSSLRIMNLNFCCSMEKLPDSIGYLTSLTELDLSSINVTELPSTIGNLEELRMIRIDHSKIRKFPDSISMLKKLEKLSAKGCRSFKSIPPEIGGCTSLRELNLSDCEDLKKLPDSVGNLRSLHKLDLSSLGITELPESIGNLKELRMLKVGGTGIQRLPASIGLLNNLQMLSAVNCVSLEEIPSTIEGCTQLRELDLKGCKSVKELPDSVENLRSLHKLDLSFSGIIELPETTGNLKELSMLLVDLTGIRMLPTSIGMLKSLQKLSAVNCVSLEEIPSTIEGCTLLRELDLSGCESIKELPDSVGNLRSLQKLDLSYLGISELPESIGNLKELRMLRVDGTGIQRLPASIGLLNRLQMLSASNCVSLEEIPSTIEGCAQLRELDLRGCENIEELPVSECYLKSLPLFYPPCDAKIRWSLQKHR